MKDTGDNNGNLWTGILDQLPLGIIIIDARGIITRINSFAEELLGLEKDLLIGASCRERICPQVFLDCPDTIFDLMRDALDRGIVYDQVDLDALLKGNRVTLRISTRLIKEGEKYTGVLLYFTDYTAEKILEEQVRRNECLTAAGQMAAGICHEIRNPLQSVRGFVQLFQERDMSTQEASGYTEIIISEIDRMNALIKEYLQLARPTAAKFAARDLNAVVGEVVLLISSEAILRNIMIEENFSPKMPVIMLDESRIKQVLINILSNALDAIFDQGTIEVKTWFDFYYREAYIYIADSGIGMDQATVAQLGKPFFTTKEEGTGLGLVVSYRIIEDHGGRILVESSPGKGTKFTIILPESAGLGEKIKNKGKEAIKN